eukprot:Plantae.Rhodophyta-Rhodochaete_pulchella.ctg42254.p2 GENE.Plantae.Rhodophyta-Rhodochaete_pulchella.ctg42254~~Plantae.Rhodophyta-Rhodochaete_pulchella.ctg42254.p2  ORF type:complete len:124 (-),score=16.94 Plantae.Rhodophyta-Rhodochaete_pulchella.ctg42254:217-588(-)
MSCSFSTMNIGGDGNNVFHYESTRHKCRLDVSNLAQWQIVFELMDHMGIYLHFKMQERENDKMLDREERTLYRREFVARFAHHLAPNWDIGEETTLTTGRLTDYANEMQDISKGKAPFTGFPL